MLEHIFVYACVEGELHLKSLPKIFVITIYVLSSSKRGRLLAQRPLALYLVGYFDDNKPYLVMYLTMFVEKNFRIKQVDLTAPHQDSQVWSSPKICIPKSSTIGSFGNTTMKKRSSQDQDQEEYQDLYLYFSFLDILSKPS